MTDILVYTEEQDNVIAGSVEPREIVVAVVGEVGGGGGGGAVDSVNGQIGHVVLDAADVGADAAGTAAAAVAGHEAALDPHPQYTTAAEAAAAAPVQSVNSQTGAVVLSAADVGADPSGTAGAAVAAHETDTTPHAVVTQVNRFGFNTTAGLVAGTGEMVWNASDGTADLGLQGGVTLQIGQEQLIRILNKTGSTIENMHVVYLTGAQGSRVTAAQAQANNSSADKTLAVATQAIPNNAEGLATLSGLVRDIDTSTWAEGTELWLSASTAGAITNVRPAAPNHQVRIGYVVRSHPTTGSIYVTVNIGADMSHLHDVVITAPADGDVLIYDSTTQTWQNGPQTGGSGEVNTASNLGAGAGVFASKVGADLQFKSLIAGAGVTLTPTATGITIVASGAGGAVDSVNGQTGVVVLDTDDISEGVSNLYHTDARVRDTVLTGLSLTTTGAVAATDTVLQAFGKLEKTKAPLASPAFTGAPTAPTATAGSNTTQIATTEFVRTATANLVAQTITNGVTTSAPSQDAVFDALALKSPINSPTFTGFPAAPTASPGDNTTKLATTAFVAAAQAVAEDRANHTGTQPSSTISDFNSAARAQVEAELVAGANVAITPSGSGASRQLTIAASSGAVDSVNGQTGTVVLDTDDISEGATNKYFTEGRVRSTVLTGLSLLTGGVISAADGVLSALGKLQKQISDAVTAIGGKQDTLVSGTNLKTVNGNSLLGAGDLPISGSGMANPMTTAGDLIVGGTAGAPARLAPGTNGYVLTMVGGVPYWAASGSSATQSIIIACSDEATALTAGTNKVTFRMPYGFTLSAVRASLATAQVSGSILTIDINEGGATVLSTKLTIDNTEKTSTTAAVAAVISDTALADDAEITIDIDQVGDGTAKGLKVVLIGVKV